MIHLLIDGYNLMYVVDPGFLRSLEEKRNSLLEKLHGYQTSKNIEISIVFDGSDPAIVPSRDKYGSVMVIFTSEGETADEWIDKECRRNPGKYLVVSNDNEVIRSAEQARSVSVSSTEFAKKLAQATRVLADPDYFDEKDDSEPLYPRVNTKKKGVSKKAPKKERRKIQRLRGL